ncbi:MAG: hypothetical protein AAFO94_19845, partial [Bacteroidota bacterium]
MNKKYFTFLLCTLSFPLLCFSTHNRAGEIQIEQEGPGTIEASIVTYTKASSQAADRDSVEICWGDGSCEWVVRDLKEAMENDFQKNIYTGTHSYAT